MHSICNKKIFKLFAQVIIQSTKSTVLYSERQKKW